MYKTAAMKPGHLITEYLLMPGGLPQGTHLPDKGETHSLASASQGRTGLEGGAPLLWLHFPLLFNTTTDYLPDSILLMFMNQGRN